jgi:iron complex outermembrane receptor protein
MLCTGFLRAQTIIRGKITDQQTGEVLPGATIKAGTKVALASADGNFTIELQKGVKYVTASFTGYEARRVPLSINQSFLSITLASNNVNLSAVSVTGYQTNRKLLETAGSIGILNTAALQRGDNIDIMAALNTIPGVKMEAYTAGNYRISIRGSLINNPWGIRNLRVYWNDIPLSSPDGTAQKSIDFDPAIIGSVEILKGPSGSMFGAGNGGVLLIKNAKAAIGQNTLEAGYTAGSYGFSRLETSYKAADTNFNIVANVIRQRYDGYRENNWGNKDVVNIFSEYIPGKSRKISFFVTHARGSLGIAGGLTRAQMDSMPRQAVRYNKDNKTSVKRFDATALGASQTYNFSSRFSNITSVYGNFQTYDHPFGSGVYYNGYLKESLSGYGGRTKFLYAADLGKVKSRFSLGAEYQYQHQLGNTFAVINDVPGTWPEPGNLRQNDIVVSKSSSLFAQAELDLPFNIYLTAGASFNRLSYDILDLFKDSAHVNYSGLLKFPDRVSPRIGLVKKITQTVSVHASMSYGYSPPPVSQINNYDGTLNMNIKPEDGRNYELGVRGEAFKSRFNFDVTTYQMHLKNAIVPVARPNGTTAYRNAGATNQKGIEALLSYLAVSNVLQDLSFMKAWISYTYNDYTFTDYKTQSFDWASSSVITLDNSGKHVTGVVPHSLSAGVDIDTRPGFFGNIVCYYYDKIPLNDANTYYSDPYSLLNIKLGYKKIIGPLGCEIFAGINNAFNVRYSSLILYNADANGIPPQFFNPSPGVNYYTGLKLKYNFK